MKTNKKDLVCAACFFLLLFGFSVFFIVKSDEAYLESERRAAAQKPILSAEKLESGRFMSDYETYMQDQFPLRENLRTVKAFFSLKILGQGDNHGIYEKDGYLSQINYPLQQSKLERNAKKLKDVYETFLKDAHCRVFLSVIPEKNCYLAPQKGCPAFSYEEAAEPIKHMLDFAEYIDISHVMSLENFYKTDQHWRQETLKPVAEVLLTGLNAADPYADELKEQVYQPHFKGTYCGQYALPVDADELKVLVNEKTNRCQVFDFSTGKQKTACLYDPIKAEGRDPYELFLEGSVPLITIRDPEASQEKKLIVFRDSFASSMAPLLMAMGQYSEITLVDLRYMQSSMLESLLRFENCDVLFLYSTLILNNSISM